VETQPRKSVSNETRGAGNQAGKSAMRQYAESAGIAIVLALVMRATFVQAYMIPSGSMEPTLLVGDHIFVNKIIYGLRMPNSILGLHIPGLPYGKYLVHFESIHHGDVIVFVSPQDRATDLIKRVIGMPGDKVEVRNGAVWLNGAPMNDPQAHFIVPPQDRAAGNPRDNLPPVTVPAGKLFMMGDNRDNSYDSRYWGFADQTDVEGRAMIIYWSWDSAAGGPLPLRWNRFAKVVD
jgi:signal peptidase I